MMGTLDDTTLNIWLRRYAGQPGATRVGRSGCEQARGPDVRPRQGGDRVVLGLDGAHGAVRGTQAR